MEKKCKLPIFSGAFYYQCDNTIDYHLIFNEIWSHENFKFWRDQTGEISDEMTNFFLKKMQQCDVKL